VEALIEMMIKRHLPINAKTLSVTLATFASMEDARRSITSVSTRNVKKASDAKMGNASSKLTSL
jgi:hypothetical protein